MLNDKARSHYESKDGFVFPDYNGHSLADVQNTVLTWFGVENKDVLDESLYKPVLKGRIPRRVIVIFIDGFGYLQWKRYFRRFEFLKRFTEKGMVTPITTVFPSTTAAAVTSTHTGVAPIRHGLPEWYIYFRKIDSIIATLPFKRAGTDTPDALAKEGFTADDLFHADPVYLRLGKVNVPSYVFLPNKVSNSVYSSKIYAGARIVPYHYIPDMFVSVRKHLRSVKGRALLHVYIPDLDGMAHTFGPYTEQYEAQLSVIMHLLKTEFADKLTKKEVQDTAIIIIADHGQLQVDPQKVLYLNNHKEVADAFETGKGGDPILPVGSPRDMSMHIKAEKLPGVERYLAKLLKNKAMVARTSDLIDKGLFGRGRATAEFRDRMGNLCVLPYGNNVVWWNFEPVMEFKFYGMHGGLSEEEMLIPFAIAWLSDLVK